MRKYLFMTIAAIALVLAIAGAVSADGGPHGGFTATTDGCAGCHRAHTAPQARLLLDTPYNLCISCHGSAGTGADTNVEDGFFLSTRSASTEGTANTTDNAPLLGGGFVNHGAGNPVTSAHEPDAGTTQAWGTGGAARGVLGNLAGAPDPLTCSSCHDPHGSSNYRIIPTTVNGVGVVVAQVDEGAAKDYDDEQWGTGTSDFCAACHGDYHQTAAGQGSTLSGASYTHRIDMQWDAAFAGALNPESVGLGGFTVPLAQTDVPAVGDGVVVCTTCHLPHGTSATATAFSIDPDGAGAIPAIPSGDSALLRLDNRGVCEVCHQK